MNDVHVRQIFAHYVEQFEQLNNSEHREYYKWQIAKSFRDEMDAALKAPNEELPKRLHDLEHKTSNLIDSYTQPFYGLTKFAEREPETVREMFKMLYSDDGENSPDLQRRVSDFLEQSHALRDMYYPDSYLYKDDMHSVTGYLFLYDPDHNYIFKSSHAQVFADCVEFYDDWGSGDDVKLDVYYRMCDQLVEAIRADKELMLTDAGRFKNGWGVDPETLYPDPEKHILAFDIIYCCSTYGLFDGISFVRPKPKERQLIQERREKALDLAEKLEEARRRYQELEEAKEYINSVYLAGCPIHHKMYGVGIIRENSGTIITVDFPEAGEKKLGTFASVAGSIISANIDEYEEKVAEYKEILKNESSIKAGLSYAEREFVPYAEYVE